MHVPLISDSTTEENVFPSPSSHSLRKRCDLWVLFYFLFEAGSHTAKQTCLEHCAVLAGLGLGSNLLP